MPRYSSNGKQVLRDGVHFADASDNGAAVEIAQAMNADLDYLDSVLIPDQCAVMPELRTTNHAIRQESDEYACACGARWDVSDGEDHP